MQNGAHHLPHGWLIAVNLASQTDFNSKMLFVAALDDADDAVAAVRCLLGQKATVVATCRFSPRALMRLRVKLGEIRLMPTENTYRPHKKVGMESSVLRRYVSTVTRRWSRTG
jgi:hypothetical protein